MHLGNRNLGHKQERTIRAYNRSSIGLTDTQPEAIFNFNSQLNPERSEYVVNSLRPQHRRHRPLTLRLGRDKRHLPLDSPRRPTTSFIRQPAPPALESDIPPRRNTRSRHGYCGRASAYIERLPSAN